jgi:Tctex-1 family
MEGYSSVLDGSTESIQHTDHSRLSSINTLNYSCSDADNCADSQKIQTVVDALLSETLSNEEYEPKKCKQLSEQLARQALERISRVHSTFINKHIKHVVVVSIGNVNNQLGSDSSGTVYFGSRCFWNRLTDFFTTTKFSNSSLYAIAFIFTLRYDNL